jgi:hypothetical protein
MIITGRDFAANLMEYRRRKTPNRVDFQPRPKIREEINIRTAPMDPRRRGWEIRQRNMEALGDVAPASGSGWSWLTDLVKTGAQTWGTLQVEKAKQKALVETFGGTRTVQAMSAIDAQRALEARERALELERAQGVTAPLLSGMTPWLIGGAVVLGAVLLMRRK